MGIVLLSSLLGVATLIVQVSTSEDGNITLSIQASSVQTGDSVVLSCRYQTDNYNRTTTFFKDGQEIGTYSSAGPTNRTIENVTEQDEGNYTCASQDRKLRSNEVRLSVRLHQGYWKWVVISCTAVLLSVLPLTVWLVCRYRYQMLCTRSCWPVFKQEAAAALPATRQDVTEVQWELSWMEMSSLMDKHLYPGT